MTFRPGELDQRVTVSRRVLTPDNMGGFSQTWTPIGTFWAHVRPLGGNETARFDSVQAIAQYMFVFRNGLDVRDEDLLTWKQDNFNIRLRREPKKRDMYIVIEAERGVAL